jgi:hypothetical protein
LVEKFSYKIADKMLNSDLSLIWRLVSVLSMLMLAMRRVERGTALFSTYRTQVVLIAVSQRLKINFSNADLGFEMGTAQHYFFII